MARISIAIASYNGAGFIQEQLDSFTLQSRRPDEVVITDDGSTDDTLEIVQTFARTAPFEVQFHRNEARLGYSANFSRAVSLCKGDVIFISDQDDRWFETKIEKQIRAIEEGNPVVINDQVIVDQSGKSLGTVLRNNRALGFPDRNFVTGACTAMTREFATLALPFPEEIAYDSWIATLADLLAIRTIIEEPLQLYRRHGGNTTDSIFAQANPTTFDLVRRYGFSEPRSAWLREIRFLDSYRERLEQNRALAEKIAGPSNVHSALATIEARKADYSARLEIIALPKIKRLPAVAHQWRKGVYSEFFGWKSALKDLIRP